MSPYFVTLYSQCVIKHQDLNLKPERVLRLITIFEGWMLGAATLPAGKLETGPSKLENLPLLSLFITSDWNLPDMVKTLDISTNSFSIRK